MKRILVMALLFSLSFMVEAHQTSTSFLTIEKSTSGENAPQTMGIWKVSLKSLATVISLDKNNDGNITWSEIKANNQRLFLILQKYIVISSKDSLCMNMPKETHSMSVEKILDALYLRIAFNIGCNFNEIEALNYSYYFNTDSDHKAIVSIVKDSTVINMLSVNNSQLNIVSHLSNSFMGIVKQGIWHILVGYDHIIFLLTLILGVMLAKSKAQERTLQVSSHLYEIVKVVSAFTVAHSITLALAALDIIVLPSQFIEITIAATLIIAALHNIRGLLADQYQRLLDWPIWKMAFVFGLIHGFGFANVLTELSLTMVDIARTLVAFNLGVEIGQVIIVILFIMSLRIALTVKSIKNRQLDRVLPISSGLVSLMAVVWLVERSLNIEVF